MSTAAAHSSIWPRIADLVALTKPRVTSLVIATAAVGMGLAPGRIDATRATLMLVATVVLVGSANALNCWLERDTDGFMGRTAERPLPAGRLDSLLALGFGLLLCLVSLPLLFAINWVTGLLGLLAIVSYVGIYTPLKFLSPQAMVVGAIPGALPPLMGYTAVTGHVGVGGVLLFGIVFLWQMPHVIGLSTYRRHEYAAAGIRVLPLVAGDRQAQFQAIAWAAALLPCSVAIYALGLAGPIYLVVALGLSAVYLAAAARGVRDPERDPDRWGRRLFFSSLYYLPVLFTALLLDAVG
ncbi:MAG: heme o synthase [Myxococcales bacterium]|nr:heme o synthase [Myxococcales bacterium]